MLKEITWAYSTCVWCVNPNSRETRISTCIFKGCMRKTRCFVTFVNSLLSSFNQLKRNKWIKARWSEISMQNLQIESNPQIWSECPCYNNSLWKAFPMWCDQCNFQGRSRDKVTGDLSCDNIYQCKIIMNIFILLLYFQKDKEEQIKTQGPCKGETWYT